MTKKIIHVKQSDIDGGVRASAYSCPVSLALSREIGQGCGVISIYFRIGDDPFDNKVYRFPEEVTEWIRSFDLGANVKPITFTVEIP